MIFLLLVSYAQFARNDVFAELETCIRYELSSNERADRGNFVCTKNKLLTCCLSEPTLVYHNDRIFCVSQRALFVAALVNIKSRGSHCVRNRLLLIFALAMSAPPKPDAVFLAEVEEFLLSCDLPAFPSLQALDSGNWMRPQLPCKSLDTKRTAQSSAEHQEEGERH